MPRKKFLPASFNVPALLASVGVAFGIVLVVPGLPVVAVPSEL
jgi:hypothetical protein